MTADSNHKFKIGQTVNYVGPFIERQHVYEVRQLLPFEDDEAHCRIKSAAERHERAVKESQLTVAAAAP
jgi:hypothetical protein